MATPSETFEPPIKSTQIHVLCSFCGNNTHKYVDCPVLQQFVRQQSEGLAEMQAREYYAIRAAASVRQNEPQRQGSQPNDDTRGVEVITKTGKKTPAVRQEGSSHDPNCSPLRGWQAKFGLSLGGGSGPPPGDGGGGPPGGGDDEDDDDAEEEGDETDEETMSVTASSVLGDPEKGEHGEDLRGLEALRRIQMTLLEEEWEP